jgi:hypothetical protein
MTGGVISHLQYVRARETYAGWGQNFECYNSGKIALKLKAEGTGERHKAVKARSKVGGLRLKARVQGEEAES